MLDGTLFFFLGIVPLDRSVSSSGISQIKYKESDSKQLVITLEKWHRTFSNIDTTITDKSLREPLQMSKPSINIKNSSLFLSNKELTNFYETFSDFRRFSETHRTMKWNFNERK